MKRMWFNQPSTLHRHHDLHGTNVLAEWEGSVMRVWFLSGPVVSMRVGPLVLSNGWLP